MSKPDRAASALQAIDPSCDRETWVRAGMAAKSAGLEFEDFNNWSALGDNYAGEHDCHAAWKSFGENGRVTSASLYAMAFARGWKDPSKARPMGQTAANGHDHAPLRSSARKTAPAPSNRARSNKAATVWNRCEPAPATHPYLVKKGGIPDGLRIYPTDGPSLTIQGQNVAGFLVVPCWDGDELQTLQFVPSEGAKLNLPNASFGTGSFLIGNTSGGGPVYVVEGVGQAWAVHAATGSAAAVCFGAGRMSAVATSLRARNPTARLVLVPDRAKECQAEAIAAAVNGEWCELPADKPANYDVNDYALEFGADALSELLERAKRPPMRFNVLSGADLSKAPPLRWLVRGVLPLDGLAALYGPSGSGKSFLMLDIAAAIAAGDSDWFGRRVTQCPVTYCALEGEGGMGKRIAAWSKHHNKPVPNVLRFVSQPFDILEDTDVSDLAKAMRAAGGADGLVILDTLNRAAPGADENSSVDMGRIIAAAKRLQTLVGGLVLLVHHTGKDTTKGLRGHSSLYAALDGAIEVSKTDARREWSVAKSKDDETGSVHAFKLEVLTVGYDEDGEEITSCVAIADDSTREIKSVRLPQGGNQKIALDALGEPLRTSKEFNKDGAPNGRPCIRLDAAVRHVAERLACEPKRRTERATQALTALVGRGVFGLKGDWLWRI
ncbi:AAA family ATPase [Massilia alkalitolerans]|uniref:AAA family ATPase n=1 Tax=Massilia alkalitolerans TaxID=286638 RepID=UPI0028B0141A|nr:AAA family ATPase [Massilia alkalitolerans]